MLRQMMKLEKARRAVKDGRFQEALTLAEDPEIRDHVKAQKLRATCLEALKKRAAQHEKRGDLSQALAELRPVGERVSEGDADELRHRIEHKMHVREEAQTKLRQLYYRAKLEIERGDIQAARRTVESVPADERGTDLTALHGELVTRGRKAVEALAAARRHGSNDPPAAEAALAEAAALDGRCPEIGVVALEIAQFRIAAAMKAELSDGALAAWLIDHGIFRRKWLAGSPLTEVARGERALIAALKDRIKRRFADGQGDIAALLTERLHANSIGDDEIRSWHDALAVLRHTQEAGDRGELDVAEALLVKLEGIAALRPKVKEARSRLASLNKVVPTRLAIAEAAMREGKLGAARSALVELLEAAPLHEFAKRLLAIVSDKMSEQERRLIDARSLLGQGKVREAQDLLLRLRTERSDVADVSALLAEASVRLKHDGQGQHDPLNTIAMRDREGARSGRARHFAITPHLPVPGRWLLAVEERGECFVIEDDVVVIGNAVKRGADLPILANIASRHAEISREMSFHGGVAYRVRALEGRSLLVNARAVEAAELKDGDQIRLGPDFAFKFRLPSPRSKAALLELQPPFNVEGASRVVLLPRAGRLASIFIGPEAAHVPSDGLAGELEIYREKGTGPTDLVVQAAAGVSVEGEEPVAKAPLHDGVEARSGGIVVRVRAVPPS